MYRRMTLLDSISILKYYYDNVIEINNLKDNKIKTKIQVSPLPNITSAFCSIHT